MGTTLRIVEGSLEAYRKFYERTPPASRSLFSSPEFLSYRDPNPLTFLEWRNQHSSVAQSACWVKPSPNGDTSIVIPGGASFGGPVAQRRLRVEDYVDMLSALVDYSQGQGHAQIEWTPPLPHHGAEGGEEAEFAALQLGFHVHIAGLESVACLPVTHDSKFQNLLRRCQRESIEYVGDIELDAFYPTLEGVYSRHEARPTHSREELAILKARFPQDIRFVGAQKGGQLAATACLFRISPVSELVFYMCTVDKYKKENPMMLLIAEDMKQAYARGCKYYNFGTSSVELSMRDNVWAFKKQFGSIGLLRRRFIWANDLSKASRQ